jgi:hypothetical protein
MVSGRFWFVVSGRKHGQTIVTSEREARMAYGYLGSATVPWKYKICDLVSEFYNNTQF